MSVEIREIDANSMEIKIYNLEQDEIIKIYRKKFVLFLVLHLNMT